ncbi:MAG: DUF4248 domain-containing protein [Bacteroidota bacterium]|jgi:hypothetical protein
MDQIFTIRTYGFGELAQMYFPAVSPKTASTNLNNWIRAAPELREALHEAGRRPGFKILSPAQVRLIVEVLGEP